MQIQMSMKYARIHILRYIHTRTYTYAAYTLIVFEPTDAA